MYSDQDLNQDMEMLMDFMRRSRLHSRKKDYFPIQALNLDRVNVKAWGVRELVWSVSECKSIVLGYERFPKYLHMPVKGKHFMRGWI